MNELVKDWFEIDIPLYKTQIENYFLEEDREYKREQINFYKQEVIPNKTELNTIQSIAEMMYIVVHSIHLLDQKKDRTTLQYIQYFKQLKNQTIFDEITVYNLELYWDYYLREFEKIVHTEYTHQYEKQAEDKINEFKRTISFIDTYSLIPMQSALRQQSFPLIKHLIDLIQRGYQPSPSSTIYLLIESERDFINRKKSSNGNHTCWIIQDHVILPRYEVEVMKDINDYSSRIIKEELLPLLANNEELQTLYLTPLSRPVILKIDGTRDEKEITTVYDSYHQKYKESINQLIHLIKDELESASIQEIKQAIENKWGEEESPDDSSSGLSESDFITAYKKEMSCLYEYNMMCYLREKCVLLNEIFSNTVLFPLNSNNDIIKYNKWYKDEYVKFCESVEKNWKDAHLRSNELRSQLLERLYQLDYLNFMTTLNNKMLPIINQTRLLLSIPESTKRKSLQLLMRSPDIPLQGFLINQLYEKEKNTIPPKDEIQSLLNKREDLPLIKKLYERTSQRIEQMIKNNITRFREKIKMNSNNKPWHQYYITAKSLQTETRSNKRRRGGGGSGGGSTPTSSLVERINRLYHLDNCIDYYVKQIQDQEQGDYELFDRNQFVPILRKLETQENDISLEEIKQFIITIILVATLNVASQPGEEKH